MKLIRYFNLRRVPYIWVENNGRILQLIRHISGKGWEIRNETILLTPYH